jgi:hypothetical protein
MCRFCDEHVKSKEGGVGARLYPDRIAELAEKVHARSVHDKSGRTSKCCGTTTPMNERNGDKLRLYFSDSRR